MTRKTWSDTEKKAVLDLLAFHNGMKRKTLDFLQSKYGNAFKTVTLHTLKRWQHAQQRAVEQGNPGALNRKRGKKVCTDFEDEVYQKVSEEAAAAEGDNSKNTNLRLYATIIQTADALRRNEHWKDNERVQKLKFSHKWCHSLLRRNNEQHHVEAQRVAGYDPQGVDVDTGPTALGGLVSVDIECVLIL